MIKGMLESYKRKGNKKHMKLTKSVPVETSHPLRSELNEVAELNIPVYEDIDWNIPQEIKIIQKEE